MSPKFAAEYVQLALHFLEICPMRRYPLWSMVVEPIPARETSERNLKLHLDRFLAHQSKFKFTNQPAIRRSLHLHSRCISCKQSWVFFAVLQACAVWNQRKNRSFDVEPVFLTTGFRIRKCNLWRNKILTAAHFHVIKLTRQSTTICTTGELNILFFSNGFLKTSRMDSFKHKQDSEWKIGLNMESE
jgi:hypothetical protein